MPWKDLKKRNQKDRLFRKNNPNYHREWRIKNPNYYKNYNSNLDVKIKRASRLILNSNIRLGKIVRLLICENCQENRKTEGHHDNYNKPLEVRWLCKDCHEKIHATGVLMRTI